MHEIIKAQMASTVPFVSFVGIELLELASGRAVAALDQRPETSNHLSTMHAGALFTLGETASGAAMAGTFAAMLLQVRPVAAEAQVRYLKVAKGRVQAMAKTTEPPETILASLEQDGVVRFTVDVDLIDAADAIVATMTIGWHISRRR
jgi:uncharacterized protein (TIGR00369 family)